MTAGHEHDVTVSVQGTRGDLLRDVTTHRVDAGREKGRGCELGPIVDHRHIEADPNGLQGNGLAHVPTAGNHQQRRRQDRLDEYLLADRGGLRLGDEKCGTAAFQAGSQRIAAGKGLFGGKRVFRQPLDFDLDLG